MSQMFKIAHGSARRQLAPIVDLSPAGLATEELAAVTSYVARTAARVVGGPQRHRAGRGGEMFERFTDRARRVVVLAQEEARMLNHNHIGTEHILLGLIHEGEGVAAKALESLGISLEAVRQQVEEIIGQGEDAPQGHIPFTPRAKKVLELSLREASHLGHPYIGTEHILLGLIREGQGVAAQVLVKLGADLNRVRQQVIQLLHGQQARETQTAVGGRRRGRVAADPAGVNALESRLAAVEHRVGNGPDTADLDEQIAQVRQDKESAIDAQDFERAGSLRDRERQLLADKSTRQQEWEAAHPDLASLAEQVQRLSGEVERLRGLLRQHGIDPEGKTA
jgi:ATP-dependent Clp protease ATP-binding subunit ClpA